MIRQIVTLSQCALLCVHIMSDESFLLFDCAYNFQPYLRFQYMTAADQLLQLMDRHQLAQAGQQQVLQLLRSCHALLNLCSNIQPTTEAQGELQALQQQYLQAAAELSITIQQCQALQQQDAAAHDPGRQQACAADQDAAVVAQLQAQVTQLQGQLEVKNQAIKQIIDKLRHLIDAFNMWESHNKHLTQHAVQYAAAGAGSMV